MFYFQLVTIQNALPIQQPENVSSSSPAVAINRSTSAGTFHVDMKKSLLQLRACTHQTSQLSALVRGWIHGYSASSGFRIFCPCVPIYNLLECWFYCTRWISIRVSWEERSLWLAGPLCWIITQGEKCKKANSNVKRAHKTKIQNSLLNWVNFCCERLVTKVALMVTSWCWLIWEEYHLWLFLKAIAIMISFAIYLLKNNPSVQFKIHLNPDYVFRLWPLFV